MDAKRKFYLEAIHRLKNNQSLSQRLRKCSQSLAKKREIQSQLPLTPQENDFCLPDLKRAG
jgi:hypothetical protein